MADPITSLRPRTPMTPGGPPLPGVDPTAGVQMIMGLRPSPPPPPPPLPGPRPGQPHDGIDWNSVGAPKADRVDGPSWLPSPPPPRPADPAGGLSDRDLAPRLSPPFGSLGPQPSPMDRFIEGLPGDEIDWRFIEGNEVNPSSHPLRGAVPPWRSGVTVAHGFDLGGKDAKALASMGLDQGLIARMAPYLGPKGPAAKAALVRAPLTITATEAAALDKAVQKDHRDRLIRRFDAESTIGPFRSLPANTQTALADVYFRYDPDSAHWKTPELWRQVTNGKWQEAYENLMNFRDREGPRGQAEARLLSRDIQAGSLPQPRRPR